uniref:Uncharacterized protein n=1 Tax=Coccidioides posadasii RMSCC 3488 TaxID=454284 RepID=A0A0J6F1B9_COCPO|nr:hypothetical protein CPAG_00236 [Coccidioides posadasii RMSCC 3488]
MAGHWKKINEALTRPRSSIEVMNSLKNSKTQMRLQAMNYQLVRCRPICVNFYLEIKGPEQPAAVARRHASYDGAFGARSVQSL